MGSFMQARIVTTPAMLAVFSDESTIRHALAFEGALALAQAEAKLISSTVAQSIADLCASISLDARVLAEEAAHAGTLAIPLVDRLRAALQDNCDAAAAIHRGATSQDLSDTVLMAQAKEASLILEADLGRAVVALTRISRDHRDTAAMGRTLLQDAVPIAFGLRTAQWLAGIGSALRQFSRARDEAVMIQLGGAAGSRAAFDGRGAEVTVQLGLALGLPCPPAPWHAQRCQVASLAASLGIVIGALGKIARDISLLAQNRIGEAREPAVPRRGGSSAMPHKRNPTGCRLALSAAARAPGLVGSVLTAMSQEQERGLSGFQVDVPVLTDLFLLAGGSANALADVLEGLDIDVGSIDRNLAEAQVSTDLGESAAIVDALLEVYGKEG